MMSLSCNTAPDFVKAKTWLCREMLGFLFIWYHADGEAPSWELEDEPEISSGRWQQTARFERVVYGHIQDICENGADVGHFENLHKASGLVPGEEYASNTGHSWKGRLLSHEYDISWSAEGTVARTKTPIRMSIFGRNFDSLTVRGLFKFVGPALLVFHGETRWGSLITTMSLTPVGPLEVKVVHLTFSEPRLPWIVRKAIYMGHRNMVSFIPKLKEQTNKNSTSKKKRIRKSMFFCFIHFDEVRRISFLTLM